MIALIERATLAGALKTVTAALAKGNQRNLPILAGVRIDRAGDQLTLTCTNIDLTIIATVMCEPSLNAKDGTVIVPAQFLARIVGVMNGEMVEFAETKGGKVTVTCGDTTADLVTFETDTWPKHLEVDGDRVELDKAAVAVLGHAVGFTSGDDAHGTHQGVHFGPDGITATDRYRGLIYSHDGLPEVTVPTDTLSAVLRATDGPVMVGCDERTVSFSTEGVTWVSTLLAGEFPKIGPLLRATFPASLTFDVGTLSEALGRVGTLGSDKITFHYADGVATLSAYADEVGAITDNISGGGDFGEPIMFNIAFLASMLAVADTDEITLEIADSLKPVIVHAGAVAMLVVPIRIGSVPG